MNVLKNISCLVVGSALLVACGKTTKDVVQTIEEPTLMKTWSAGCGKSELLDVSAKSFYQFAGKDLTKAYELYNDDKCATAVAVVKQEGAFDLRGSDTRTADAKALDFHYRKIVVTALNADGQKLLEKVGFCDQNQWPLNQPVDVTAKVGGLKCPLPKVRDEFDIYRVNGETLWFGEGKFFGRAESADKRPTKIDTDKAYKPENRSF